jgi:hypothetical protein
VAVGAFAIGALTIGRLMVLRLVIQRAEVESLEIGSLGSQRTPVNVVRIVLALASLIVPRAQTATFANIDYVGKGNPAQVVDIYVPSGNGPFPLMVYIHGGGWMTGDKDSGNGYPLDLNPRGIAVASINYRMSGEAILPAPIQDCKAAIRFLRANATKYKIDPDLIGAMGIRWRRVGSLVGTSGGIMLWDTPDMPNPTVSSRVITVVNIAGPTNLLAEDPASRPVVHLVRLQVSLRVLQPLCIWAVR